MTQKWLNTKISFDQIQSLNNKIVKKKSNKPFTVSFLTGSIMVKIKQFDANKILDNY